MTLYIDLQFWGGCLTANVFWVGLLVAAYLASKRKKK
jgi:hypothetical protein